MLFITSTDSSNIYGQILNGIIGLISLISMVLTWYRVYKRKLPLNSWNTWICYILYPAFVPTGGILTAWELA